VNYTRYGDDLTFSFPSGKISMRKTYNMLENELDIMGFRLKKSKSQYVTMGKRFMVTGVVINEKLSVSRSYIKWIRAVIYDCETNGIQQASNKYAQLNIRKYSIFKIRKLRLLRLYCEISNVHKLESKDLITIFFIDSINGHLSFIDYIRGPNDTIVKNLKDRFSSISSGHELTIEPNIFSSQDTLAYITNATSNSVAYYAYTFLRFSKYTDEEIDQLRKIFSNKRNKIEFNLIKDSLINQSAFFIKLYNYMIHNNRFEEFYSTMQDTDREALFKYDIGLNGQSPYMRFVYHNDFSCELIRNDYIEDDKHFKNTGVFYENAIKSDYKGYILLRQLLDQFGMRACLKCGNGKH